MYSWSLSWISWCLVGASEVRGCNLCFSLLDWAAVLDSGQQGAVLNEVSVSAVTFCPLRLMGTAAVLSGGRIREKRGRRERERTREWEWEKERQRFLFFFLVGWRVQSALHITTVHQEEHWKAEKEAGGFTFAAFSPCFTSQLCLDKPHSTCVITTDTVTFSRHKFRHCLGD